MALSSPLTVVAMMNGMIGGLILVLPVSAHQAGYIFTIIAIIIAGAFSFLSCYLSLKHLGDQKDMNFSMLVHFNYNQAAKIIYDIFVWLGLLFGSMFYYGLVCIQWQSITGKTSVLIPILNAIFIFFLIFVLKYFDFGASLMAYGIISIISYMIFLIWVLASAPSGHISWTPIGTDLYSFGSAMSLAFAIQAFFIPVIMKNPKKQKHVFLTFLAYVIGACAYAYISFMGVFGVINRIPLTNPPQTIQDYFPTGNVQVTVIQCIYLIHLYTCLPQFVLISKKRLFDTFKIPQTKKGKIPIKQIIYSLIFLGICLLIRLLGVQIDTIISINGSIVGFFNIYLFPAVLHIKCIYFPGNKIHSRNVKKQTNETLQLSIQENTQKRVQLQLKQTKGLQTQQNKPLQTQNKKNQQFFIEQKSVPNHDNPNQNVQKQTLNQDLLIKPPINQQQFKQPIKKQYYVCDCQRPKNIWLIILDILLILIMVAIGVAILVNGMMGIFG